ncbi:MAG: choice-of-anchor J domain-containing protein [Prevotella sp.]|nr:choice-of-anchor J domain-containing protein [Prevotella sp.]
MKKITLLLCCTLMALTSMEAQTILEEDFETGATASQATPLTRGEGWTTVNSYSGSNYRYNWFNEYRDPNSQAGATISGAGCAGCDGPINVNPVDGSGPREEILLSPELDLNDTYQLQFSWIVSPMNAQDNSRYDLQVRVVTDGNLAAAETVFSIQNEQMLRESGVTVFPIDTWDLHTSKVDLSDWKGEKVKLAFVYKMFTTSSNIAWIDDISVKKFTPATGPVATVSLDRYDFKEVYVGEKLYSEVFTLTNTGKDGLRITGVDFPQGVSININTENVNLRAYDHVDFQLAYEASMTSPASGDAILHTTGGDVKIAFTAMKQLVPEDCMLETFNGYFPPAGWRNSGWSWTDVAIEGDHSVYCGGDFSNNYLRSPRLDLSDGGTLRFTYYNQYDGEYAPEYDIEVQVSYDNGETWTPKWTSDYVNGLNQLLTAEVDLGVGSDESYVRFFYPAVESDDEGAYDHSSFTLDRVVLPHVYGADGVPGNVTLVKPANNAQEVYPKDVVLEWGPAQFADGYKLYVGTNSAANDLIDGLDVGNALTYTIPVCAYETTYRWKVVGYNEAGSAAAPSTWRFTTQPDASVMEFPWTEDFDACTSANPVPTGWLTTTTEQWENRSWQPNTIFGYGGKGACMATGWMYAGNYSTLTSPEFHLPAEGQSMSISFVWGDEHPRSLIIDETGLLKKQNVEGGNGYSDVVFEIYSDGAWKQLSYLSENFNEDGETKYWRNEQIDLTEYAGKNVQFRWINHSYSGRHNAASLDNVVINGYLPDNATFNKDGWEAGKVNHGKAVNSGDQFTLLNRGKNDLQVKAVTFKTENFQSSLMAGQSIKTGEGVTFNVQFNANDSEGLISDLMTVEFEGGATATFPVSGEALPANVLFYGFERNPLDYVWSEDFTTKDVDGQVNYQSNYYLTILENDGGRYAFTLAEHNNPNLLAHTGKFTLAAAAPDNNSAADDWLISKQIVPTEETVFDFYARNLSTTGSVFVGDNDLHSVSVLVSEAGNTDTKDFTVVIPSTEMPYLGENEWNHFSANLSAYAGKPIYVAVRHTTVNANWLAFFDDFTFSNLQTGSPDGIEALRANLSDNTPVTVYNANGVVVAKGGAAQALQNLEKGLYVVKTADGQSVKAVCK